MFHFIVPKLNLRVERWKWNKEYRIYVSTLGHFKDEYKKPIPVKTANSGYLMIQTNYGLKLAHRLVMFTWRPTSNMESLTVDHLNHNKRDNSLENLEWVSFAENQHRAKRDLISKRSVSHPDDLVVPSGKICICGKEGNRKFFDSVLEASEWIKMNTPSIRTNNNVTAEQIAQKMLNHKETMAGAKDGYRAYTYHWYFS